MSIKIKVVDPDTLIEMSGCLRAQADIIANNDPPLVLSRETIVKVITDHAQTCREAAAWIRVLEKLAFPDPT